MIIHSTLWDDYSPFEQTDRDLGLCLHPFPNTADDIPQLYKTSLLEEFQLQSCPYVPIV